MPLRILAVLAFLCCLSGPLLAGDALDLSLEELMNVEISSVSKKPQQMRDIAAAVHVITAEDIRRSGAVNVQEALRLAPGLQSLAVYNGRWSVSIRGAAQEYVNKLLVLIDGRSVYSPTFSGLFWETLEIPLDNIARIEVIRGPGASIWGSNAVNGVINIVTRSAHETQGGYMSFAAGNKLKATGLYRYGYKQSESTSVRIHANGIDQGESNQLNGTPGKDAYQNRSVGFRLDRGAAESSKRFMLQGHAFTSNSDDDLTMYQRPPAIEKFLFTQKLEGLNLSARWDNVYADDRSSSFQASFERSVARHILMNEQRNSLELEFNQRFQPVRHHDLVWGMSTRITRDKIGNSNYLRLSEQKDGTSLYRLFFNDDITLRPERLRLSLSASLEHNEYSGFEFQPSLRLLLTPDEANSLWAAVSKAARVPFRLEQNARYYYLANPNPPRPFVADTILQDLDSEKLTSYDLGWRRRINQKCSFDVAGFYFKYSDALGSNNVSMALDPGGYLFIERALNNKTTGDFRGGELAIEWKPSEKWQLQGAYSYINVNNAHPADSLPMDIDKNVPVRIYSLFSNLKLNDRLDWSAWFRHTGSIEVANLPAYDVVDSSLSWKVRRNINLAIVAQNLFDKVHQEFTPRFVFSNPREFGRRLYLKTEWNF